MSRKKILQKMAGPVGNVVTTKAVADEVAEATGDDVRDEGVAIISEEEAEKADVVICSPDWIPSEFTDDIHGTCAHCGTPIHYRPHTPKRPMKLCIMCGVERAWAH